MGDREKAALLNAKYKALEKEYVGLGYGHGGKGIFIRALYQRILELSYKTVPEIPGEGRERQEEPFDMSFFGRAADCEKLPNDFMLCCICEERWKQQIKIQEYFPVKNLAVIRYLPLITGYLLQNGEEFAGEQGVRIQARMRFAAFWIFELDDRLKDERQKADILKSLLNQVMIERGVTDMEDSETCAQEAVMEYIKILQDNFPKYLKGNEMIFEAEKRSLLDMIRWRMDKICGLYGLQMDLEEM